MIGSYYLQVKFGESVIQVSTNNLVELTIIQDLNKFLPEFRLRINDTTGALTHIAPFDRNMNKVTIELAPTSTSEDKNSFNFNVYTRQPEGDQHTPVTLYDITGMLDVSSLFNPSYSRGFTGNIKSNLENLAAGLGGVSSSSVSNSLNYDKNLVQPTWTNAQFLNHLKKHLIGQSGEYGYKCNIVTVKYQNIFQFKPLSELLTNPVAYRFLLNDQPFQDLLPIFNYYIYDNYKLYGAMGAKSQQYSYFDYMGGKFVVAQENAQDYLSLSEYFLIDGDDSSESNEFTNTGHTNDFEGNFQGRAKGDYGTKLNNLVKMWITTQGLPNIAPGQVIGIFFPQSFDASTYGDNMYAFQYAGYWLVEQVIHMCGTAFYTKLLLTRPGLDTDRKTTLLKAANGRTI